MKASATSTCCENKNMIERGVCPRCLAQILWEEGWAYCATCTALYCTDAEANIAAKAIQGVWRI